MQDTALNVLKVILLGFVLMVGIIMVFQTGHLQEKVIENKRSLERTLEAQEDAARDRQALRDLLSRLGDTLAEARDLAGGAQSEAQRTGERLTTVADAAAGRERELALMKQVVTALHDIRRGLDTRVYVPAAGWPAGGESAVGESAVGETATGGNPGTSRLEASNTPDPGADDEPEGGATSEVERGGSEESSPPPTAQAEPGGAPPRPESGPGVERYHAHRTSGVAPAGGSSARWGVPSNPGYRDGKTIAADGKNIFAGLENDYDPILDGGVLRRLVTSDFKGFNYITESFASLSDLQGEVHDFLANRRRTDPDVWQEGLAWSCEIHDDYRTYVFRLRKGVLWNPPMVDLENPQYSWLDEPHEVTAHDLKFYFDLILDPEVRAGHIQSYYGGETGVADVYCPDDFTLVVKWKAKTFQSLEFTLGAYPIPRFLYLFDENGNRHGPEVAAEAFNDHWYDKIGSWGCGAYYQTEHKPGISLRIKRNERYWGRRGNPDEIDFQIIKDMSTMPLVRLKSGELDEAPLRPVQYETEVLQTQDQPDNPFHNGRFRIHLLTDLAYYFIGWNQERPLFGDKRVRRALTHCMPREQIIESVWMGMAEIVTGNFFYQSPANDASIEPWAFELAAARKLLGEAGWKDEDGNGVLEHSKAVDEDGKPLEFRFHLMMGNGSPEWHNLCNQYREELKKVGIIMELQPVDWPVQLQRMTERDFDAVASGWALGWEPDPYQIWHSSQADEPNGSNRIGFRNAEADAIIEELRRTFEPDKRISLCHEFHRIIHEEQPYTFLFTRSRPRARNARVSKVVYSMIRPQTMCKDWAISE